MKTKQQIAKAIGVIVEALRNSKPYEEVTLRNRRTLKSYYGLCDNLSQLFHEGLDAEDRWELRRLFRLWPEYSGNFAYPVPCKAGLRKYRSNDGLGYSMATSRMWSTKHQYGRARLRLCRFIAEHWGDEEGDE